MASKVKHFAGGEGEFLVHLSLQGEADRKEEEANGRERGFGGIWKMVSICREGVSREAYGRERVVL